MSDQEIIVERKDPVAIVIFNREKQRNAHTMAMRRRIPELLEELEADPNVKVIVFRGAGDSSFMIGGDLAEIESNRNNPAFMQEVRSVVDASLLQLVNSAKPMIAMINGYCIGGGVIFALACDLRIASDRAYFCLPGNLSMALGELASEIIVRNVGFSWAKELILSGATYNAQQALNMGMVHRVVEAEELASYTLKYAQHMARRPALALECSKFVLNECLKPAEARDLERIAKMREAVYLSQDFREGVNAFLEKRQPQFTDR
ncbi:MAG: enoyl-CoA hydratase/isomerase family protein [Candidatus Tectomicrobia bacterium]|uniref:Enoyl-CoA hydratase/isomerase family protein n=1 Tax=Tectimicrobiota bacterium TaxID=2528274 RepID=A0A932CML1_UNCTE|nr:enoyl-CoA hydratase/isomerase family protein [Candidatus Tectomicrobia bacterium]